ncbi:MAG TPA: hypothetical protein VNO30_23110 [Kofleriaceae bacterium]|nr:hypothetical protein [Kofleriaceae bacterium]
MNKELAELISMYEEGSWSRGDFLYQMTLFIPAIPVQALVEQIPDALRDDFVTWLRVTYENETSSTEFVSIGMPDDHERTHVRIEAIRTWLRTQPMARGE